MAMNSPHNGSSWGGDGGGRGRGASRCYVTLKAPLVELAYPLTCAVCVAELYTRRFYLCMSVYVTPPVCLLRPCFLLLPPSGPSYSCDGACRRRLGHIRALFGQARPVSLRRFRWGHFLFLISPFQKNNLIVVSRYWQYSWRFDDERQITADVQSKRLTDIHANLKFC